MRKTQVVVPSESAATHNLGNCVQRHLRVSRGVRSAKLELIRVPLQGAADKGSLSPRFQELSADFLLIWHVGANKASRSCFWGYHSGDFIQDLRGGSGVITVSRLLLACIESTVCERVFLMVRLRRRGSSLPTKRRLLRPKVIDRIADAGL